MGCATSSPQVKKEKKKDGATPLTVDPLLKEFIAVGLIKFSRHQLEQGTQKFNDKNLIGIGGFGDVFKGSMFIPKSSQDSAPQGEEQGEQQGEKLVPVAVKRLKGTTDDDYEQFMKEVLVLGRLRHPNLVHLYGFGVDNGACLVLELMEGGSLHYALEDSRERKLSFSLRNRIKVLYDSAAGLEFLHSKEFIHRDIKCSNILLEKDYHAKLTDFGMVRVGPDKQLVSLVTTRIMGTEAYIDPSYLETGHLGYSSDVYSFGVVIMEMITGKDASQEASNFVSKTRQEIEAALKGEIPWEKIVDPCLPKGFDIAQVSAVATQAVACTSPETKTRPSMEDVKKSLDALRQPS